MQRPWSWQEVMAAIGVIAVILTGAKTWWQNDWRMERLEKDHAQYEQDHPKIQKEYDSLARSVETIRNDVEVMRHYFQSRGWIDQYGNPVVPGR